MNHDETYNLNMLEADAYLKAKRGPFFSIITPSLQRDSLARCCESINVQTLYDGWQHIVQVDCADLDITLINKIEHPQREIYCCGERHGNYGNKCRHIAWEMATGSYCIFLDDDNQMTRPDALEDMARLLTESNFPNFAIFPIHRHGWYFFNDPPGMCMTDSANIVPKREIGRWPDIEQREADGVLAEYLRSNYEYAAFPQCPPIITMDYSSNGL